MDGQAEVMTEPKSGQEAEARRGEQVEDRGRGLAVSRSAEMASVAAASAAKARVEAAYVLALKHPRDEERARAAILSRCRNPEFAEACVFKKKVGSKQDSKGNWIDNYVTGLSIRFAEEALRLWHNVGVRTAVIYEDDGQRIINVSVTDFESNTTYDRDFVVSKTVERKNARDRDVITKRTTSTGGTVFIVRATEDELSIKEAALASKMIRNNGLRLMPAELKDTCFDACQQAISDKLSKDPEAVRRKMIGKFGSIGVTTAQLEDHLKHPLAECAPEEIQSLGMIYNAIESGEMTWKSVIDRQDEEDGKPDIKGPKIKNGNGSGAATPAASGEMTEDEKRRIEERERAEAAKWKGKK